MRNELKPVRCGCGGEVWSFMTLYPENTERPYICQCRKCFIRTGGYPSESEAIEAWNTAMGERTAKVEVVEKPNVFKCSECGQYFYSTAWGSPIEYCSRCGARLIWGED